MYPRYEYSNLDVTNFEHRPPFEQQTSYHSMSFDQNSHFLPEIDTASDKQSCRVCTLPAHGMHFGVQTCRPCAAFFRRIVVLDLKYTCVNNTQKCNVDGRGRNVCRDCRYKKCIAVGMTTDNVQYNRDSHHNKTPATTTTTTGRTKNKRAITVDDEAASSSTVKLEDPNSEESCSGCSDGGPSSVADRQLDDDVEERDAEEMDRILSDLKYLFVEYGPPKMISQCSVNQLQRLTHALILFRQNQQSANQIKFRHTLNLFDDGKMYYQRRSEKFSKWVKNVDFFDTLSEEEKIISVKMSFTVFDRLERSQMSIKVFGEAAFIEKKVALSSYCAVDLKNVVLNPQTHANTEQANNYIISEFHAHADAILEEIVKPMFELQLSDTETAFLLTQVLVYNTADEKAPISLVKKFDELRENVAADIHYYYTKECQMEMYSNRLLKIMNLVNAMKKIHADRVRKSEMIRVFDIYKISEKRQDFNCS